MARIPWNKGLKTGKQSQELIDRRVQSRKGYKPSKETKELIRQSALGRVISDGQKKKMSLAHKGKKLSEAHKKKIGESQIGRKAWNKGKTYEETYGKEKADSIKSKQSKIWKGKKRPKFSKAWREKIGLAQIGKERKFSDKHKEKLRVAHIKCMERQFNDGLPIMPQIGNYETGILNNLEICLGFQILRQYKVKGYFVDGYCKQLNLAIEIDEPHHRNQIEKDLQRQKEIESTLGCNFVRIKLEGST